MIEIKVACRVDLNMIEKFYNENQLNLKNEFNKSATYVIVLENKEIIGASQVLYEKYILQDVQLLSRDYYKIPVVEMLFIISKERKKGLGDGLLRTSLNYLFREGSELILLKKNVELNSFYLHEGMDQFEKSFNAKHSDLIKKVVKSDNDSLTKTRLKNYYYCIPKDFFSKGCKS